MYRTATAALALSLLATTALAQPQAEGPRRERSERVERRGDNPDRQAGDFRPGGGEGEFRRGGGEGDRRRGDRPRAEPQGQATAPNAPQGQDVQRAQREAEMQRRRDAAVNAFPGLGMSRTFPQSQAQPAAPQGRAAIGEERQGRREDRGERRPDVRRDDSRGERRPEGRRDEPRGDRRWDGAGRDGGEGWNRDGGRGGWDRDGRGPQERPTWARPDGRRDRDRDRPRYDLRRYQREWRPTQRFRVPYYQAPYGYYDRLWSYNDYLPWGWYGPNYWIDDWRFYGLPIPPMGCEWVRVGRDALLVDVYTGRILAVGRMFFW